MTRSLLHRRLVLILVTILLGSVAAPFFILYIYVEPQESDLEVSLYRNDKTKSSRDRGRDEVITLRKALDVDVDTKRYNDLKLQIEELERIKVSVRNEMRELEKKRNDIISDTEKHKFSYHRLQDGIHKGKKQLNVLQADLLNVAHQLYAATPPPTLRVTQPPPIFIIGAENRDSPITLPEANALGYKPHPLHVCSEDISLCIDFSKCPLSNEMKFYIYPVQSYLPSTMKLKHPTLLENFITHLKDTDSLTENPNEACLYIVLMGPIMGGPMTSSVPMDTIYNLAHWGKDGSNHVLINLIDFPDTKGNLDIDFNPHKAIIIQHSPHDNHYKPNIDVLIPVTTNTLIPTDLWTLLPPILPAQRKYLFHFSGEIPDNDPIMSYLLNQLAKHVKEPVRIELKCFTSPPILMRDNEIGLCGDEVSRSNLLRQSTFTIVPMGGTPGLVRLAEALKYGVVPVIIGSQSLPFHSVIDWSKASLSLPVSRLRELHFILRSITANHILELRQQGRFLWETYFSSAERVLVTVATVLRSRLLHPPPLIKGYEGRTKIYNPILNIATPTYRYNHSIYNYRYWNSPPGPTPMFPHTPWDSAPVSGSAYSSMTDVELSTLPPHILQAGGITGPFFENYLLSDRPLEYFTVVMLTYKREEVVLEAVERLAQLKFLAKVIIVWNDLDKSPFDVQWPKIDVPVEVVWANKNSLNNRFIPYNAIQTEAVLSIDDDVYLRHDEIQFAFRVWRESRERLVGFPGRFHAYDVYNRKWLYNSNYTCELSMVLTGAAFYHKYYNYLYTHWQPKAVLELVDKKMNCEDIAMNFLVAHITRKPPLKVTSRWTFHCPNCPDALSQSDAHFNERHDCINTLTNIYGYVPLLYTQFRLDSVLFKTRLPSHLEKCYQYV